MGERSEERKEQYKRIRSEFEDLEIEDKALFILEATVATVARGIEQFGKGFADEIDKAFRRAARKREEESEGEGADAPAPEAPTPAPAEEGASADEGAPAPNETAEKKPKPSKGADDKNTPGA